MKRYISAILVPCLLLQLFGCYAYNKISEAEIDSCYQNNPIRIITTDDKEFILKKDLSFDDLEKDTVTNYCSEYAVKDNTFLLVQKKLVTNPNYDKEKVIKKDILTLTDSQIKDISIREGNKWTLAIIMSSLLLVGLIALLTWKPDWDFNWGKGGL